MNVVQLILIRQFSEGKEGAVILEIFMEHIGVVVVKISVFIGHEFGSRCREDGTVSGPAQQVKHILGTVFYHPVIMRLSAYLNTAENGGIGQPRSTSEGG